MATFPSLQPLNGVKESSIGKVVTSSFDGNYKQQRRKTTRIRKQFEMDFALSLSEYQTLDTFFQTYLGVNFEFTHPITSTVYNCRFSDETLDATYLVNNLIKVKLKIEEI